MSAEHPKMTKPFSELTEDEKMMKLYQCFLDASPREHVEINEDWWIEVNNLYKFAREKLAFLRALHKIEEPT